MPEIGDADSEQANDSGDEAGSDRDAEPLVVVAGDPDQAWKALTLVNDWIKHAESKAVATLAASGILGTILYNLVKEIKNAAPALNAIIVLCAIFTLIAGAASAMSLLPRLRLKSAGDNPTSPLYFSDIARDYASDGPSYSEVLYALSGDTDSLTRHIAHQVHSNAAVAHRKYRWATRAIVSLVAGLLAVSIVAIAVGISSL